jgi:hypothetical protein
VFAFEQSVIVELGAWVGSSDGRYK